MKNVKKLAGYRTNADKVKIRTGHLPTQKLLCGGMFPTPSRKNTIFLPDMLPRPQPGQQLIG
jgi:hypothetical protein